jgi:hypothetical protein
MSCSRRAPTWNSSASTRRRSSRRTRAAYEAAESDLDFTRVPKDAVRRQSLPTPSTTR